MNHFNIHSEKAYSGSIFRLEDKAEKPDLNWKKDRLFTQALQESCLSANLTSLVDEEIVITGSVLGDGKGDWAHMNSMAKAIVRLFPEQKIAILPLVSSVHKGKMKGLKEKNIETELTFSDNPLLKKIKDGLSISKLTSRYDPSKIPQGIFDEMKNSLSISKIPSRVQETRFLPETLERIREASLIIKMSTDLTDKGYIDLTNDPAIKQKECFFPEYGSRRFSSRFFKTMGLDGTEQGIFTKRPPKIRKELTQLSDKALLNLLFNTENPEDQDIKEYFLKHSFNLAYVHGYERFRLVKTLIFLLNMDGFNNNKNVDICIPLQNLNKIHFTKSDYELFEITNIGKITLINKDKKNNFIIKNVMQIGAGEREIRLINAFPLSKKDMKILMCFEQPEEVESPLKELVGCTGDSSCSEVLSYSKAPFYERRSHKYHFYQDLIYLVEQTVGINSPYYKYLEEIINIGLPDEETSTSRGNSKIKETCCKIVASRLYEYMTTPGFMDDVRKVSDKIRTDHSANRNLLKIIIKKLLVLYKSEEASKLYAEYANHKIDLAGVKKRFEASLLSQQAKNQEG